jgi:hypothetical protein
MLACTPSYFLSGDIMKKKQPRNNKKIMRDLNNLYDAAENAFITSNVELLQTIHQEALTAYLDATINYYEGEDTNCTECICHARSTTVNIEMLETQLMSLIYGQQGNIVSN